MPFPSALDVTQKSYLRGSTYYAQAYVAVCPSTVIFRASINQSVFSSSFAQVTFDTVTIGAYTDIKQGMTVFIGTGTNLAAATFTGRVRKVGSSTVLYINETSAAITDNMTISVIDDRRVWDRLQRVDPVTLTRYKDYDLTFEQLAPTIYGLQSSYVLVTTGVSASISFTPSATAQTQSASISSWLWDVEDGTITIGTSTTQNITVSFPTGHRWVRLSVTDSGGRVNFIDFEVYCGDPRTASWSLQNVRNVQVNADVNGYNATFDVWANASTILDMTRVTIFTVEKYGTSSSAMVSNINIVGYLKNESGQTAGDDTLAQRKTVNFSVDGFGTQLGNINMVGISAINNASPSIWGQINQPTPVRFNAYLLIYHTTITNLCSITFGTGETSYIFQDLSAEQSGALDSINTNYDQINGRANFAPSGEMQFNRNANYLSSAGRNALTTVVDVTTVDMLDFTLDKEYGYTVGRVLAGFGGYNTTTGLVRAYSSKAPAESALGSQEEQQLNSQILIANQTETQNRSEAGQRTGDHLAYINPKYRLDVTFGDGWWWLNPANFQWYTFTITTSDNLRGLSFTTSTRWLCVAVSYNVDNEKGRRSVTASFEQETTGNSSQVLVALIPSIANLNLPTLPMFPDYPFDPPNPAINYPTNDPSIYTQQPLSADDIGALLPIPAPAIPSTGDAGCQTLILPAQRTTNLLTSFNGVNMSPYEVTVNGSAQLASSTWSKTFDFTASDGGWSRATTLPVDAVYSAGVGWIQTDFSTLGLDYTACQIKILDTGPYILTRITVVYDLTVGATTVIASQVSAYSPDTMTAYTFEDPNTSGTNKTQTITGSFTSDEIYVIIRSSVRNDATYGGGTVTIKTIFVEGVGTPPTWATGSGAIRGDAFYHSYDGGDGLAQLYPTGYGLYANDVAQVASSAYNPSHEYTFTVTGDGLPLRFRFENFTGETPSNELFTIKVCGDGAGDFTT